MQNKKEKFCVYCRSTKTLTNDHIPPKALFPKPRPNDLITVISCQDCNNLASIDDEYFKKQLIFRESSSDLAKSVSESTLRGLQRPEAKKSNEEFLKNLKLTGDYHHPASYDVDLDRLARVTTRIIKGLFYCVMKKPLPKGYFVESYALDGFKQRNEHLTFIINKLSEAPKTKVGNGDIFQYRYISVTQDPNILFWGLSFYKSTEFIGWSMKN